MKAETQPEKKKLSDSPFFCWVKQRIDKNKNAIIIVNGPTGSGKSYSAMEICRGVAEINNAHFSIKDNVSFSFTDMLEKTTLEQNKKPGTPFLLEEVGATGGGASSREWQSQANKFFFSFMQTSRHRNQVIVMTTPHFEFLEKGARNLVHMQIDTMKIDFRKKVALLKPHILQVNTRTGKIYFKFIRTTIDKKKMKVSCWVVPKPPEYMIKDYEAMKTNYTDELNKSMVPGNEDKKRKTHGKVIPSNLDDLREKGLNYSQIAMLENISQKSVKRYFSKDENGYLRDKNGKNTLEMPILS